MVRTHLSLSKLLLESGEANVALEHVRAALLHLDQREELLEECTADSLDRELALEELPAPKRPAPRVLEGLVPVAWEHLTLVLHRLGKHHLALAAQHRATNFARAVPKATWSLPHGMGDSFICEATPRVTTRGMEEDRASSRQDMPFRLLSLAGPPFFGHFVCLV